MPAQHIKHSSAHSSSNSKIPKTLTKNPIVQTAMLGAIGGIVCGLIIFGVLIFAVTRPGVTPKLLPTPTAAPTSTPAPTDTPKPTAKPTAKPSTSSSSGGNVGSCDRFKGAPPSEITVKLVPDSGQMTGNTVVRIKQGGKCPGSTDFQEKWLSPGDREVTFGGIQPGTYIIEVANGNYQGVIRQTITVEGNGRYIFTVGVHG